MESSSSRRTNSVRRLDDLGNYYSAASSSLDTERSRSTDDSGNPASARELAETKAELEKLKLRLQESEARGGNLAEELASREALVGKDAGTNGVAVAASRGSSSVASSPPPSDVGGLREENAVLRARLSALESDLAIQILTERWVPAILFAMGRYEKSRSVHIGGVLGSVLTDLLRCCSDADEASSSSFPDRPVSSTLVWAICAGGGAE